MRSLFALVFVLLSFSGFAQRFAVASGDWNTAIWASTFNGVAGSAATPTSSDDVYTNGFSVTVSSDVACKSLYVRANVSGGLTISPFTFATLTINGLLTGANNATPTPNPSPVTVADALVMGEFETIRFVGTGEKIRAWGYQCPLGNLIFAPGSGQVCTITQGFRIDNNAEMQIESGTITISTNTAARQIRGCSTCSLVINSSATLNTSSAINGGGTTTSDDPTTSFGNINVNGTLITSNYVNATNFSLGSSGSLITSFNGPNQTQGWWYQSVSPTSGIIAIGSTVNFNASANQNIFTRDYDNLTLSGSGTKTVMGSGSIHIAGNLLFSNTSIVMTSPFAVVFDGAGAQSISGGVSTSTNFSAGLGVSKPINSVLTLSQSMTFGGGIIVTSGTLNTNGQVVTLTSGNIENDGVMTPTTGTFVIDGNTAITGSGSIEFFNLTINNSGSLTAPSQLNIEGNFTNNGSFNANSGKLIFTGTNQSILGSSTIDANDIDISSTGTTGVSLNANLNLNGVMTLTSSSAKFDADGSGSGVLTVKSSNVNTGGRIAALPSSVNFTGNVTIERFVDGPDNWRYLSMPLASANVGQWQANFPVTGNFTDPSPAGMDGVYSATSASVYYFDAANQAWAAVGTGASTGSTPLDTRLGYSLYSYLPGNFTVSTRGAINKNGFNIPLSSTSPGWNLVPNPYPSPIDWDNITIPGGLADQMSLKRIDESFATYNSTSGLALNAPFAGWTGEVAIGQSFWVQSQGATQLTMNENAKTNNNFQFLRKATADNYFRLTLSSPLQRDEAIIMFSDEATDTVDPLLDARKQRNGAYISTLGYNDYLNLSSSVQGSATDFAINALSTNNLSGRTIPLSVTDMSSGVYKLTFTELSKLKINGTISLIDKYLGVNTPITEEGLVYEFSVDQNNSLTFGKNRFALGISSVTEAEELVTNAIDIFPNPVKGKFKVAIPEQYKTTFKQLSILDGKGTLVYTRDAKQLANQDGEIDFSDKQDGIYILNVIGESKTTAFKILKQ